MGVYHDEMICSYALCRDSLGYIPRAIMKYRIHSQQACGLEVFLKDPCTWNNGLTVFFSYRHECIYPYLDAKHRTRCDFKLERQHFFKSTTTVIRKVPTYMKVYGRLWWKVWWHDVKASGK